MKSWAASIALHGVVIGLATLFWLPPTPPPSPLRWQVAFAPAPSPPMATPRQPIPPRRTPAAVPAPAKPAAAPAPVPPTPPPPAPEPAFRDPTPAPPRVETATIGPAAEPAQAAAPVQAPAPAPMPAASTPSPPAPDPVTEAERRWYLALLEHLRTMKHYPMPARRLGQEGEVVIEARVGPDGRLEDARIKRGSGYPMLDRDALRLLEAAAEAARDRLRPERTTLLEIPIVYRLGR